MSILQDKYVRSIKKLFKYSSIIYEIKTKNIVNFSFISIYNKIVFEDICSNIYIYNEKYSQGKKGLVNKQILFTLCP